MKKKAFNIKRENRKQAIAIEVTFILEIKFEKYSFEQIMTIFLAGNASFFESLLLEWECAYICHCLRVGKKGIYSKW